MIRDLLQESYNAMLHNRRRTALTMLGMAWGIATVVMLLAYGDGFGRAIVNIFAEFGTKLFIVFPGRSTMQAGGQKAGAQIRLTLDDVDLLSANIPQITHITPSCDKDAIMQFDNRTYTMSVNGEYPNTFDIRALILVQGRFYNPEDQIQRARVAVIGSETKDKLFSGRNALGEYIRIDGVSFEVIGVLTPKMQEGDNNVNRVVYIPFTTMSDLKDTHYLDSIWFNYETDDYARIEQSVRYILAEQHKFNPIDHRALFVVNLMDRLHHFEVITLGLKILLAFIGALTLGIWSLSPSAPAKSALKKHWARVAATSSSSFWRRRSPSLLWADSSASSWPTWLLSPLDDSRFTAPWPNTRKRATSAW
jgi:putative ABC transport system permease protein